MEKKKWSEKILLEIRNMTVTRLCYNIPMKKSIVKNIIIGVLLATCAILAVRLWFGGMPVAAILPVPVAQTQGLVGSAHHPMARHMIESAVLEINMPNAGRHVVHGDIANEQGWQFATTATSGLIRNGTHSHNGSLEDFVMMGDSISIAYNFTMPTGFFREYFGQRAGFLSSVFAGFEGLFIARGTAGSLMFYFINNSGNTFHAFVLTDEQIYADFTQFFAEFEAQPLYFDSPRLVAFESTNPIGELRRAIVQDFVSFFFPNPNAIVASTINNVYTYHDNLRVVKFYPNNIVKYSTVINRGLNTGNVTFTTSFLAALDMVNRDRTAMAALGTPMNPVAFVRYTNNDGHFTFYFEYVVDGEVLHLNGRFYPLQHAIEVEVTSNTVVRYRRLMLNFAAVEVEAGYEY